MRAAYWSSASSSDLNWSDHAGMSTPFYHTVRLRLAGEEVTNHFCIHFNPLANSFNEQTQKQRDATRRLGAGATGRTRTRQTTDSRETRRTERRKRVGGSQTATKALGFFFHLLAGDTQAIPKRPAGDTSRIHADKTMSSGNEGNRHLTCG
jgi:hypothetical protein